MPQRARCEACGRPASACLCAAMPRERISTERTSVIVLQHPLEARHKLTTVPILAKCLSPDCCQVLVGRQFRKGCSAQLDQVLEQHQQQLQQQHQQQDQQQNQQQNQQQDQQQNQQQDQQHQQQDHQTATTQMLLLFPGAGASNLSDWLLQQKKQQQQQPLHHRLLLLIIDATWQHAKEMARASMGFLQGRVACVCLPFDRSREGQGRGQSELILRKEPYEGYLTTLEAAARALGMLEPDGSRIEQALLPVLQRMVSIQAVHAKNTKLLTPSAP